MSQMHEVIARTDAPSWLGSVPNKLGEVSMATVKAPNGVCYVPLFAHGIGVP
jgi:hypothetical protein